MSRMLREEDVLEALDEWAKNQQRIAREKSKDAPGSAYQHAMSAKWMTLHAKRIVRALPPDPRAEAAERLAEALMSVEFIDPPSERVCPSCYHGEDDGHAEDCVTNEALAAWREAQETSSQKAPGSTTQPTATHRTPAWENAHYGRSATPRRSDSEERP